MTKITRDHVEWALVDRLRLMLEEPAHRTFNVTQTYSHFSSILCWVMQRVRIKTSEIVSKDDKRAHDIFKELVSTSIKDDPWFIHVAPVERIERIGATSFTIPAPQGFESHTAGRLLINLRDAVAHGGARIVEPFNVRGSLIGFAFSCAEFKGNGQDRKKVWSGKITLLQADMQGIGLRLAELYRDSIRPSAHRHDDGFGRDATSIKEVA